MDQPSLALTLDDNVHDEMRQRWEADRRNAAAFGDVVDYYALLGEPSLRVHSMAISFCL